MGLDQILRVLFIDGEYVNEVCLEEYAKFLGRNIQMYLWENEKLKLYNYGGDFLGEPLVIFFHRQHFWPCLSKRQLDEMRETEKELKT